MADYYWGDCFCCGCPLAAVDDDLTPFALCGHCYDRGCSVTVEMRPTLREQKCDEKRRRLYG